MPIMALLKDQAYEDADCRTVAARPPAAAASDEVMGVPLQYHSNGQAPLTPAQQQPQQGYVALPAALTADEAFLLEQPQRVPTNVYVVSPAQQSAPPAANKRTGGDIAREVVGTPFRVVGFVVSAPFRSIGAVRRAVWPGTGDGTARELKGAPRRVANLLSAAPFHTAAAAHRAVLPSTREGKALGERRLARMEERLAESRTQPQNERDEYPVQRDGQCAAAPGCSRQSLV